MRRSIFRPLGAAAVTGALNAASGPLRPSRPLLAGPMNDNQRERRGRFKHKHIITPENSVNPLSKPLHLDPSVLLVVSVSIGNIKDITIRALEVLRKVDYIICTNRNATRVLLGLMDIDFSGRLVHIRPSENLRSDGMDPNIQRLVDLLKGGRSVALVAASGTPGVGDVGGDVVRAMIRCGVRVTAVPGASSIVAALSIAGARLDSSAFLLPQRRRPLSSSSSPASWAATAFPSGSFFFGSSLSENPSARARQLVQIADFSCPCVFYDVPKNLIASLTDMAGTFDKRPGAEMKQRFTMAVGADEAAAGAAGAEEFERLSTAVFSFRRRPRRIIVLHELTKLNESSHSGSATALCAYYTQLRGSSRSITELGHVTVVVDGVEESDMVATDELHQQIDRVAAGRSGKSPDEGQGLSPTSLCGSLFTSTREEKRNDNTATTADSPKRLEEAPRTATSRDERRQARRFKVLRKIMARRAQLRAKKDLKVVCEAESANDDAVTPLP